MLLAFFHSQLAEAGRILAYVHCGTGNGTLAWHASWAECCPSIPWSVRHVLVEYPLLLE